MFKLIAESRGGKWAVILVFYSFACSFIHHVFSKGPFVAGISVTFFPNPTEPLLQQLPPSWPANKSALEVDHLRNGGPQALGTTKALIYRVPQMAQLEAFEWTQELLP